GVDGDQPGQHVEEDEQGPAEGVLDVVAEDPEEQHVAGDVEEPSVHEHRGEQGLPPGRFVDWDWLSARILPTYHHGPVVLPRPWADDAGGERAGLGLFDRPDRTITGVGVRDPVRDGSVFERALVDRAKPRLVEALVGRESELPDEARGVDDDDRDRDDRKPRGRVVVLQRDHRPRRTLAACALRPASNGTVAIMGYMTDMAPRPTRTRRTADPWRDTDVIDERA